MLAILGGGRSVLIADFVFAALDEAMALESILAGEALAAEGAGEGLNSQVDSLVALQIVVAAEGLGALIALEGLLGLGSSLAAVHHAVVVVAVNSHAAHHGHLAARLVHVGHDGAAHAGDVLVGVRSVLAGKSAGSRGRGGLGGRLLAVVVEAVLGSRRGVVAGVAGGSREGVGVDVGGAAGRSLGLRGLDDAAMRGGGRCHGVAIVGAAGAVRVEGSGHAVASGGGRLGAALVGVAHAALAVDGRARSVRRLRHLLGLGMVGRVVGVVPAAVGRGAVCVLHVAVGGLRAGAIYAGETVGAEAVTGSCGCVSKRIYGKDKMPSLTGNILWGGKGELRKRASCRTS